MQADADALERPTPCTGMTCHTEVEPHPWIVTYRPPSLGQSLEFWLTLPYVIVQGPENTVTATREGEHGTPATSPQDLLIWAVATVLGEAIGESIGGAVAAAPTAGKVIVPRLLPGSLPVEEETAVLRTLSHIDDGTVPAGPTGTRWGIPFNNRGGDLPGDKGALPTPYTEFRVDPGPGTVGAGARRIVVDNASGAIYYTWTHYGQAGTPGISTDQITEDRMTPEVITRVGRDVASKISLDSMMSGTRLFVLPFGIHDKRSLFRTIAEVVPLDPPITGDRDNWDALEDSLASGFHSIPEADILVVWPDASDMLRESPEDFETAVAILEDVARTLEMPEVTHAPTKKVRIVLGGAWT